jgi:uncharacterized protein (TIGR03435 family)
VFDFAGENIATVAGLLGNAMRTHVSDKTGIGGNFNIHLEFGRDETVPGPTLRAGFPRRELPAEDTAPGPSIFTALEQIGLQLVPEKGPRGFLAVDRAERISETR